MKEETQTFYIDRTINVETKITIKKEDELYFAYISSEIDCGMFKKLCWIEDNNLYTEECNTEDEYDCVIETFREYIIANGVKYARVCDKCGNGMNNGYVVCGGEEYYCTPECLHQVYTPKQWQEMYDQSEENGGNDNYWTEWGEDVEPYILFNNQLIQI